MNLRVAVVIFAIASIPPLKAGCQADPNQYGASANREYDAVFTRSETPCSANYATAPYLRCMNKELTLIEQHLAAFVEDLRKIATSPDELANLNQTDTAWRSYRESICTLPYKRFANGTIKAPMASECEWNLDRAYMKQLNGIYILSQFPNKHSR